MCGHAPQDICHPVRYISAVTGEVDEFVVVTATDDDAAGGVQLEDGVGVAVGEHGTPLGGAVEGTVHESRAFMRAALLAR